MRSVLLSPRKRRRVAWLLAAIAVVAAVVAAGVMWPNTAEEAPNVFSDEQAYVYKEPRRIELTRLDRAKALATAANFVTHAVARRKEGEAYDIVAPSLKGGISRAEWSGGNIPVVPFPVDEARWKLEYSYEDAIGLQVLLFPRPGSGLRPETFNMELTPARPGGDRRWLVSSWAPVGVAGGGGTAPSTPVVGAGGTPNLGASIPQGQARLDARWLLAPLALFLIVPLVVTGFYVRSWRRGRRAEALYGSRRTLG